MCQSIDARWIVPIIQGYIEYRQCDFLGKEMNIWIFSRRRHLHAGTRFNARGLDEEGNVGNFVETEQVVLYRNHVMAITQIRGSVPLFWSQKVLTGQTTIKRSKELTQKVFNKHINEITNDYKLCIFINLLQKARDFEYRLTHGLEEQVSLSNNRNIKITYFDFHTETKGDNFHKLHDLLRTLEPVIHKKFGYFLQNRYTKQVLQTQNGVFRTNCLDCLDRTNVTQKMIASKCLEMQLDWLKHEYQGNNYVRDSFNEHNDSALLEHMKNMWADNGDVLSKQYAGTGSTITSVTKTGKQGFMGKVNQAMMGVERFFKNNLEDDFKQECIKLLLNQHPTQQIYGIRA